MARRDVTSPSRSALGCRHDPSSMEPVSKSTLISVARSGLGSSECGAGGGQEWTSDGDEDIPQARGFPRTLGKRPPCPPLQGNPSLGDGEPKRRCLAPSAISRIERAGLEVTALGSRAGELGAWRSEIRPLGVIRRPHGLWAPRACNDYLA